MSFERDLDASDLRAAIQTVRDATEEQCSAWGEKWDG